MLTKQKVFNLKATAKAGVLFTCIFFTRSQWRTARHLANNETHPQIHKAQKLKWLEPSGIPHKTRTTSLEDKDTSKGRAGGKASIFFFTRTCPFTPMLLHYFSAVNVCISTAPMPAPNICVLPSSCFPGKDAAVIGWWLFHQLKGSSALRGSFTAGSSTCSERTTP